MRLGLRLLFGFFVIAGIAAFFVLRVFVLEVRPSVREVMEDMLVDTANILAELARADLRSMPSGGTLAGSAFARAVQDYAARPVQARIRELNKQTLDYRVYVTDASGRVVFDSGTPDTAGNPAGAGAGAIDTAIGQDYSRWRDVARTLQGQYGARTTREVSADGQSTVLVVAAPVRDGTQLIGVLSVAKPMSTVQKFVDRAEHQILVQGAWLLALSLAVGVAVTLWTVWQVRRLRDYAQQVQFGERVAPPRMPGELGELAQAMDNMRERLHDHRHLENTVRALTHELKSPMAAIAGAAELLHDELPARDRQAFALQITAQVQRQRELVERLLELSKLEHRRVLDHSRRLDFGTCVDAVLQRAQAPLHQRGLRVLWQQRDAAPILAEPELLELALANVLDNAIAYSPTGATLELALCRQDQHAVFSLRDHGPGVPAYALPRLGERFFSTPRPPAPGHAASKGSGLGLAIVREVLALHAGRLELEPATPGLRVKLVLPLAPG